MNPSLGAHSSTFIAHPLPCCISLGDFSLTHTEDMQLAEPFSLEHNSCVAKAKKKNPSGGLGLDILFPSVEPIMTLGTAAKVSLYLRNVVLTSMESIHSVFSFISSGIFFWKKCRKLNGTTFRSCNTEILLFRSSLMNIFKYLSASWSITESI